MKQKLLLTLLIFSVSSLIVKGQTDSSKKAESAKKDPGEKSFGQKAENFFKYCPVPLFSYSQEAGTVFGLAKFNLFRLSKKDTISKPSLVSGVFTASTLGRINFSLVDQLVFKQNQWVVLSYINYKKTPQYFFGIGNDITREDMEDVTTNRIKFVTTVLHMNKKNEFLYYGGGIDLANYFDITYDTTTNPANGDSVSYLVQHPNTPGIKGGNNFGVGLAVAFDSRDSRYNPSKGAYVLLTTLRYFTAIGSDYDFYKFELNARKYFVPWYKHIIALQATTMYSTSETPFYELSLMGGENQMRGYYQGAFRDKVLVDAQIEYRLPVWKMFGIVGWVGTGRVANAYEDLSFDGWKISYGTGLRLKVDTKNNTNLRFDFGFGPGGINATYINFTEAF